jgi:predicted enzyme related to lactoylglutathione lyase
VAGPGGVRVTVQLVAVVLVARDPMALAHFWQSALRWDLRAVDRLGVMLVSTDETSFHFLVQAGAGEKIGQNRIHFDLTTTSAEDQAETVTQLLSIGAQRVDIGQGSNETHVVLADPEGNEFCVIEPGNRFLATCPRLGAVNCDGTHALAVFWSEALGWPLVWEQDEETAIQAPVGAGPKITWSGPPLMLRPEKERFHFHIAPSPGVSAQATLDHLLGLGVKRVQHRNRCPNAIVLIDVDGNEFCLQDF